MSECEEELSLQNFVTTLILLTTSSTELQTYELVQVEAGTSKEKMDKADLDLPSCTFCGELWWVCDVCCTCE